MQAASVSISMLVFSTLGSSIAIEIARESCKSYSMSFFLIEDI